MNDDTLTLAIDLGTTYAKMACNRAGNIEIVPNQEGQYQTPCAVWLNRQGQFVTGQHAKNALDKDFANVQLHFVRDLGSSVEYEFPRTSVRMKPEELTAALLKSLRADAEQFVGREIRNAVITVPPAAGLAQCEATKQAAALAGFTYCLLIQDAVAAAIAAGVADATGHKTVLIYDFGGSGFSASLLRVRDGMFQVVAQAGDSFLGGTSLDREVVERVFVPALQAADPDLNLSQDNSQTGRVCARHLAASEAARLQLSRADETSVFVPGLRVDERQQPIDLECELTRSALERLAEPLVERTITTCDQVLAESRTAPAEVTNVISVGGMSLMPLVRQKLEDRFGGQIVPARIDPATAAVQGAAIFAASQRMPDHTAPAPRRIDKVHFSVSSPPCGQPGHTFIMDVWAHLEQQRAEVERLIQQSHPQTDPAPVIRPKGPFKIEQGTKLFVRVRFPDLPVDPPEDVILWEGEIGNATFVVAIPNKIVEGEKCGLVSVHSEGGLQIARVPLKILVTAKAALAAPTTQPLDHIRKAFASYACPDRDEVLRVIQGMQKILPDLDVFLDVAKLRSGEDWEKKLWQVIPESDVFYLFWSAAAKESPWVEKEWRCALASRGYEFIDPVPLDSPEEMRPPDELSKMHFNDWSLAYRNRKRT